MLLRLILRYPRVYVALTVAVLSVVGVGKIVGSLTSDDEPVAVGGAPQWACPAEVVTFQASGNGEQLRGSVEAVIASTGLDQRSSFDDGAAGNEVRLVMTDPLDSEELSELIAPVALNATKLRLITVTCSDGRTITL